MFLLRQIISPRLRTVLRHLSIHLTNNHNVHNKVFSLQQSNFSVSRRMLLNTDEKLLRESDKSDEVDKQRLGEVKAKLKIVFTCKKCNTRNSKIISKLSYEKGVVIIRCDGCKNNHLIADNLNWFQDNTSRNIESILKRKGENVRRIRNDNEGYFEAVANETFQSYIRDKANKDQINEQDSKNTNTDSEKTGDFKK